jgi:hypothetical protein
MPSPHGDHANPVITKDAIHRERLTSEPGSLPNTYPFSPNDARREVSSMRAQYFRYASAVVAVVTFVTVGGAGWKFM